MVKPNMNSKDSENTEVTNKETEISADTKVSAPQKNSKPKTSRKRSKRGKNSKDQDDQSSKSSELSGISIGSNYDLFNNLGQSSVTRYANVMVVTALIRNIQNSSLIFDYTINPDNTRYCYRRIFLLEKCLRKVCIGNHSLVLTTIKKNLSKCIFIVIISVYFMA